MIDYIAGVQSNLWYLESNALFTQHTLVVHLGWPAQGYYDACGFCFLLTNFAQSCKVLYDQAQRAGFLALGYNTRSL